MTRRRHFTLLTMILVGVILAWVLPRELLAGNWPDTTLDTAAAQIAGHPVSVYCETDWALWIDGGHIGYDGYTFPSQPTVYLSPRQCPVLHALLNNEDVGTFYAASALLTLAHEAVHQRGGEFADCTTSDQACEGRTDCAALPLVPGLAVQFFHVPATVTETYTVRLLRKVGRRRVATYVLRARGIPNPWLTRLAVDALRWHRVKPPAYQGDC